MKNVAMVCFICRWREWAVVPLRFPYVYTLDGNTGTGGAISVSEYQKILTIEVYA